MATTMDMVKNLACTPDTTKVGAEELVKYFDLLRITPDPKVDRTIFESGDNDCLLAVLTAVQPIADSWDTIALLLGISNADVKRYHQNNRGDAEGFMKDIIVAWIDLGIASWAMLVSALKNQLVKQVAVANKIAADHPRKKDNDKKKDEKKKQRNRTWDDSILREILKNWSNLNNYGKNHSLTQGLLQEDHVILKQGDSRSHEFVYTGFTKITAVAAQDLWNDNTGGTPRIISGGVGHTDVTIKITPQLFRGVHFRYFVFGKPE